MISSVQTNMRNDLASPQARRLSAGEDEIDRLLEIAFRQVTHVGRVPVVDLCDTARKRLELRHFFRPRRLKRVWQSLQVMLKGFCRVRIAGFMRATFAWNRILHFVEHRVNPYTCTPMF